MDLAGTIDTLRQIARRFTEHADREEVSPYYADQGVQKQKVEKYRAWAVKLEDAANMIVAVKADLDKDG